METLWRAKMSVHLYLKLFGAALLAVVDMYKRILGPDYRDYYIYLNNVDKEAFKDRAKQAFDKYARQRMDKVIFEYNVKWGEHTLKRLQRKTRKMR